jgi:hypothetical protein
MFKNKLLMNASVIISSLVLLGMSFGFIPQSVLVIFMIFTWQFILNINALRDMTKDEIEKIANRNMFENFMAEGPIVGPLRLVLFWTLVATFVTFNMFAWYIYVLFYGLSAYTLIYQAEKHGVKLTKEA